MGHIAILNGYHSASLWRDARSAGQQLHSVRRSLYFWHTSVQNLITDNNNTLNALMHFLVSAACWVIDSRVRTVLSVSLCGITAVYGYTWMHHGWKMWVAPFSMSDGETHAAGTACSEQQWRNGREFVVHIWGWCWQGEQNITQVCRTRCSSRDFCCFCFWTPHAYVAHCTEIPLSISTGAVQHKGRNCCSSKMIPFPLILGQYLHVDVCLIKVQF